MGLQEKTNTYKLRLRQHMPLEDKIKLSKLRIKQWYEYHDGKVYISLSGGKDSTVLADLVWQDYPEVKGVFSNTGLEYPEIVEFVKSFNDRVVIIKPKISFKQVINNYGYPIISKEQSQYLYQLKMHNITAKIAKEIYSLKNKITPVEIMNMYGIKSKWIVDRIIGNKANRGNVAQKWFYLLDAPFKISDKCCYHLKKSPFAEFESKTNLKPFLGEMASEGDQRKSHYIKYGCNAYDCKRQKSTPIAFWTDNDIWEYLAKYNIPYSKIYDMGYQRTGCMFCAYGIHMEKDVNRFKQMRKTHPKIYDYCINSLEFGKVLKYIGIDYVVNEFTW